MKSMVPDAFNPYRLAVVSRIAAAAVGGYILASLCSITLSELLPLARADAVITGMMLSFLVYAATVIACFACRTATRAWLGVLTGAVVIGVADGWFCWVRHV